MPEYFQSIFLCEHILVLHALLQLHLTIFNSDFGAASCAILVGFNMGFPVGVFSSTQPHSVGCREFPNQAWTW